MSTIFNLRKRVVAICAYVLSHEEINKQKKEEEEDEDSIHVHRYTMKNNIQTHTRANSSHREQFCNRCASSNTHNDSDQNFCASCRLRHMLPTDGTVAPVHNITVHAAHFSPRCTDGCGNAHHTLCSGTSC
ncbi:hypothetical protein C0Q70_19383 [Pomacea canaliculata]|uniref:Uncharacterized protein n=1 Tax=Pomacea canaliculata TaxID=400727 RepID=A0A2T7NJ68_POMCA|nr:hypothetical protein C0Q70_19383 [Pomacea canaliculata]